MENYNTSQFLQVRYPNGAGGKFLITSLFQFDQVAHWCPDVQNKTQTRDEWFFNHAWPNDIRQWASEEPNHPWGIGFYSRRMMRNNDLPVDEFNLRTKLEGSEYFHQCWDQGLLIADHWHKRFVPAFFSNAKWIEILLDKPSLEPYKHCVKSKLYLHNPENNAIISTLDHPVYAWDKRTQNNALKFNNQYEFDEFKDYDDFFYNYFLKQHWVAPFLNVEPDQNCILSITFADLVKVDSYIAGMEKLSNYFGQPVNKDLLRKMHNFWIDKSNLGDLVT
jgi:hypothetical protein